MVPGGVTEIIWHFAGYFQHIEEIAKERIVYEDGGVPMRVDDYVTKLKEMAFQADLDDFHTDRIASPRIQSPDAPHYFGYHSPFMHALRMPPEVEFDDGGGRKLPLAPRPVMDGAGAEKIIALNYESGGEQQLLEINQLNVMDDDDQLLVLPDSGVADLNNVDIVATLQHMVDAAENHVPESLALPQLGTSSAVDFITAHDTETAANDGAINEHSIAPGRYVNSELQNEPSPEVTPAEPGLLDLSAKGQWAMLGGNEASNAAAIVDLKEGANTMIVLGDFYKTNAIIQSNSYIDNDHIDVAGGTIGSVISGENKADNISEFEQKAGIFASFPTTFAGLHWNVDVVQGDFYDINLVSQKNILRDNDISVQETQQTHYEAHLGENEQLNLTQILNGDIRYDLIVVAGSYHGANLIYQYNVILDSDVVKVAAGEAASDGNTQSVFSGQNELLNDATIVTYGDDNFSKPGAELDGLLNAFASQSTSLDPSYGWMIPGNGSGSLNVLYVTGNYYDINAIWQVNIIADADTAIQYMNARPPEQIAGDGTLTQSVSTGQNIASNDAVIVDVGVTSSLVGGGVYQDTILIQGNLIAQDHDKVIYGDTNTLVTEIIAFTGNDTDHVDEPTAAKAAIIPDDTMGSVMT